MPVALFVQNLENMAFPISLMGFFRECHIGLTPNPFDDGKGHNIIDNAFHFLPSLSCGYKLALPMANRSGRATPDKGLWRRSPLSIFVVVHSDGLESMVWISRVRPKCPRVCRKDGSGHMEEGEKNPNKVERYLQIGTIFLVIISLVLSLVVTLYFKFRGQ
jgi:hypothetical protein